ncbi:MAG: hypothetical protein BA864_06970 [Desulfuromonadales bacterium C00003093]|nr:MAG: hypothetical protein BA864_06970 [Desulfuromonadales bacterium C00003093]
MPEKLETMDAPPDYSPYVDAAGVSGKNIAEAMDDADIAELLRVAKLSVAALAQDQARDAEIEVFEAVRAPVDVAEYRIGILSADIHRHLLSLRQNIRIRTAEGQAELALSDLEGLLGELLIAREKLLGVLGRSEKV